MVVAIYRSNKRVGREEIVVGRDSNDRLYMEVVSALGAQRVPDTYHTLQEVEAYLRERDLEGYTLISSRI